MTATTFPAARHAALLSGLNPAELSHLGQILTRGLRRAADLAGTAAAHSWHNCQDYPLPASEYDATAAEVADILSDDVLGMLLNG